MNAVALKTTVTIEHSQQEAIRCTARVDMPEYGITQGQTFWVVRSSKNDGTYYICRYDIQALEWQCSCPSFKPCHHMRTVYQICRIRGKKAINAQKAAHVEEQKSAPASNSTQIVSTGNGIAIMHSDRRGKIDTSTLSSNRSFSLMR